FGGEAPRWCWVVELATNPFQEEALGRADRDRGRGLRGQRFFRHRGRSPSAGGDAGVMRAIGDIAQFVSSKNAGPFLLILDVIFTDEARSRPFKAVRPLDRHVIAGLYNTPETDVLKIVEFDPAYAVKVTMRRPCGSGALAETDVYGAQQHVPLMLHEIDWPEAG